MRTETFSTPGRVRLDIRLGAGEIRLESGADGETTVTLEPLRDNEGSKAAVEDARVDLRERGDGSEVVVDVRGPPRREDRRGGPQHRARARPSHQARRSLVR